jgi:hypothetical protein
VLRRTSVRQWVDPRQAWVLQPDESISMATRQRSQVPSGLPLSREYPQPTRGLYGGYGQRVSYVRGGLLCTTSRSCTGGAYQARWKLQQGEPTLASHSVSTLAVKAPASPVAVDGAALAPRRERLHIVATA